METAPTEHSPVSSKDDKAEVSQADTLKTVSEAEKAEEKPTPPSPPKPPGPVDHGLLCWLQVIGAFALWTNSWGLVNSYGVFQTYYEVDLLSHSTPSQISWVGSLQAFLLLFVGVLSGPVIDAGAMDAATCLAFGIKPADTFAYFQPLCIFGNFMVVFGIMMTSICKEYWQVVLAQGITCGIGFGCLFLPGIAIVPQYFVKQRAFAGGLAAAGSGFGGVIYPIMFRRLEPTIGFGWTVRIIAFIALFFGVVATATLRNKMPAGKMRRLIDPTFFRNIPLMLLTLSGLFILMGVYVPVVYIGTYTLQFGLTGDNLAFYLVSIIQSASMVGRIVPSYFADKIGPINMIAPAMSVASVLAFAWIGIWNKAGLIVFAILYGTCLGIILGLMPNCIVSLTNDMKTLGSSMGTVLATASVGVLVGTPISGAILRGSGHFIGLQAFAGSVSMVGALFLAASRVSKAGMGMVKV